MHNIPSRKSSKTYKIAYIGVFSSIAFILQYLELRIPLFPEFLKMDLSDLPALMGTIFFGLEFGVGIQLIKNLLHALVKGSSLGVGEFANFIFGTAYIVYFGIFRRNINKGKFFLISSVLGALTTAVVAALINYLVLIPLYAKVYGVDVSYFVDLANKINSNINSLWDMVLLSVAPFNIIKYAIVSFIGYLTYLSFKKHIN